MKCFNNLSCCLETVVLRRKKATKDSLFLWNYGNQQVSFMGNKVLRIVADVKDQNELLAKLRKGEIDKKYFLQKMEEVNKNGYK